MEFYATPPHTQEFDLLFEAEELEDFVDQTVPIEDDFDSEEDDSEENWDDVEEMEVEPDFSRPSLTLREFDVVNCLGEGGFGKVVLARVREGKPSAVFALKTLPKDIFREATADVRDEMNNERRALSNLPWNAFINGVIGTFSDSQNLYMALEIMPYGNFGHFLRDSGPFEPLTACFYYCNVLCGLEFVHSYGLVLRDLKPDNILLGHDGYLCLTDFGLAERENEGGAWAFLGTSWYMAPELIKNFRYLGGTVDWWASGVLLYEMLSKEIPFPGYQDDVVFASILTLNYKWPTVPFGNSVKHLISRLLGYNPENRLGFNGAEEVANHPWFSHVDWVKMKSKTYQAPWIPRETEVDKKWHHHKMPGQGEMKELNVKVPPVHLRWDQRYRKKEIDLPVLPPPVPVN